MTVATSSKSSSPLHIEQLFNTGWIKPRSEKRIVGSWIFWAYVPIGLIIFLIRLGILIQFLILKQILPKSEVQQKALVVMGGILGVTISTEGEISKTAKVYVSNHITLIDHFVIHCMTNGFYETDDSNVPSAFQPVLGIVNSETTTGSDPLIFFPEQETTNGVSGLLNFVDLPTSLGEETMCQPIAISVTRPFLNMNSLEAGSRTELFLTLLSINTHYTLKFLPTTLYDRADAQRQIASTLRLEPTKFDRNDKAEYLKKVSFRPMSMASMARLVQQQLQPLQVTPDSVIIALEKTGSVEGAVKELRKAIAQPSFPKNAVQRMCTFQERKRQMIEAARERYLEKQAQAASTESSTIDP